MNFIKRAFLSVTTRIGKSFSQLLIFTAICVLVISGLAIQTATEKSADAARQSLGATVSLEANMENLMSGMFGADRSEESGMPQMPEMPEVDPEVVRELATSDVVLGYNLLNSTTVSAENFEAITFEDNSTEENTDGFGGMRGGMMGGSTGDISLQGVSYSEAYSDFSNETSTLIEGRHLTQDDIGEDVAVIEENLAIENDLSVGDSITLTLDESELEVEIVGIYQTNASSDAFQIPMASMYPYNKIYVPYTAVNAIDGNGSEGVSSAQLYLSDPSEIEGFIADEQANSSIDFEEFTLSANDSQYESMTSSINAVASSSKTIVYVVAIGGSLILGLMVMMSIRERKAEIGILLAVGESKARLIGQFIVEGLVIAAVALGIASVAGNSVGNLISNYLLVSSSTSQMQGMTDGMPGMSGMPSMSGGNPMGNIFGGAADAITTLDISITAQDLMLLAIIGVGIVIVSTIIPSINIIRMKPKTILTKMD